MVLIIVVLKVISDVRFGDSIVVNGICLIVIGFFDN